MINQGTKTLCIIPATTPTFDGDMLVFGLCADNTHKYYRIEDTAIMHGGSGLCLGVSKICHCES